MLLSYLVRCTDMMYHQHRCYKNFKFLQDLEPYILCAHAFFKKLFPLLYTQICIPIGEGEVNMFLKYCTKSRNIKFVLLHATKCRATEARVLTRVNPCGICGGQSGTGTGFLRVLWFSPVNILFHRSSLNSYYLENA
jgi:hypothetical protein